MTKKMVNREQVIHWLEENVTPKRLRHILGVEEMAKNLARHYNLDPTQAQQAGLMHDLAKYFKSSRLLKISTQAGLDIDPICQDNPHLLHADVSAIVAEQEFAVQDEEILAAIRNHTLGRPTMSDLSCVVFVADALEPNRGNSPQLKGMREVCWKNLYKSVWQTCDYSLAHLITKKRAIHPRMVLTRNWALRQAKSKKS